jgi:hypothetical protein
MWKFVLCTDERTSPPVTNVGEVPQATDRRLSFRLNRASTLGFKVREDDPLADVLLEGQAERPDGDERRLRRRAHPGGAADHVTDVRRLRRLASLRAKRSRF